MFFVITHHIDVLPLATLPTHETCPYCNNQDVWLIIRQKGPVHVVCLKREKEISLV